MSASTGPILAAGGIAAANTFLFNSKGDFPQLIKIAVATTIAAVMLQGAEHINTQIAVGIAWISLVTALLYPPAKGKSFVNNLLGQGSWI
jgi:hypothetical protein